MYQRLKAMKADALLTAGLCALLGAVLLVWPALSASLLSTALGAVLVLCGGADILVFLGRRDGSLYAGAHLALGVILAAVGLWLMTRPTLVAVIIPRIVGVFLCIHGVSSGGNALALRRGGFARWTTALALAAVTLALGLVLVLNPFGAFTAAVRVMGGFLVYDGLSAFWIARQVDRTAKRAAGGPRDAVDVEFRETEE